MLIPFQEHGSTVDLDRCAQEQVQIIGHIQPHGLLFSLSEPDLIVRQVSDNLSTLLGLSPESVLDRSFEIVLGSQVFKAFQAQLLGGSGLNSTLLRVPVRDSVVEVQCVAHRQDGGLIVELEPIEGAHSHPTPAYANERCIRYSRAIEGNRMRSSKVEWLRASDGISIRQGLERRGYLRGGRPFNDFVFRDALSRR